MNTLTRVKMGGNHQPGYLWVEKHQAGCVWVESKTTGWVWVEKDQLRVYEVEISTGCMGGDMLSTHQTCAIQTAAKTWPTEMICLPLQVLLDCHLAHSCLHGHLFINI